LRAAGIRRYAAGIVPDSAQALAQFLREELAKIQNALDALADGQKDVTTVAPAKPRDGMLRYAAAGVLGVSEGFYGYYAGSWKFLG
jgi:hypothetical protein